MHLPIGIDSLIVFLSKIHDNILIFDFVFPFFTTNSTLSQNLFKK